jgi:hypothetical protein
VYDAVSIEARNKPAISLVNQGFVQDAVSTASSKQMPGLRYVALSVPCESRVVEDIKAEEMDNIIKALTKPLTPEEISPKPREAEKTSGNIFQGNLDEVNQFFYKRGWADGLPIIPPTQEKVNEMLTGTDLPADYVVGKIIPRLGKATIEKIAVNAVMAGCLPTYMPVLITAVETLLDPETNFGVWEVSVGSFAPFWIINGPIRHDVRVNCGQGALSPGDIANAAIGRAMGLIIKNIGGARKGIEDMGALGNAAKYTQVLGENEEESPWEPLHVEHGFNKEDSTITSFFPCCQISAMFHGSDDKSILQGAINNISPTLLTLLVVLRPQGAKTLAKYGWTKQGIREFIREYARTPARSKLWLSSIPEELKLQRQVLNPDDSVPIFSNVNLIRVIVAGGVGGLEVALFGGGRTDRGKTAGWVGVTKKIQLPKNWDKLVEKYKGIVPKYIMY